MVDYTSETQIQNELDAAIIQCIRIDRPILTHLNADTSWLIQISWPSESPNPNCRYFYNILLDPWFKGSQSDVACFFSTQEHLIPSSVQTIDELNHSLREIQNTAAATFGGRISEEQSTSFIDLVVISHEFTDHCHQATLLELDPSIPIFATDKAASIIQSWNHFTTINTISAFSQSDPNWTKTFIGPLPPFIDISRLITPGNALSFHSAILLTITAPYQPLTEAIIYSPHGIIPTELQHFLHSQPQIHTLALLHGLHDVGISWTKQLNLGGYNGLAAQRACKAKYWIGTHDEVKIAGGLIAPFLRRKVIGVRDALNRERLDRGVDVDAEEVEFFDLKSGESLLLE